MSGYAKLSSSIVLSTVWREPNHVRIVWITMLALADARGYVGASVPGLADAARVTIPECEDALQRFLSPDPYSRSKAHDGRRIEVVDGGWRLVNYELYRAGRDPEERRRQTREATARWRARRDGSSGEPVSHGEPTVSHGEPPQAQAEAEAEAEAESRSRSSRRSTTPSVCVPADDTPPNEHTHASSSSSSRRHHRHHPLFCKARGAPVCLDREHVEELADAVVHMPREATVSQFAAFAREYLSTSPPTAYDGDIFRRGRDLFDLWRSRLPRARDD